MGHLTPWDVARNVSLASCLEPLGEKDYCTTRSRDKSPSAKLEFFITAGVNIAGDFYELADRVIKARKQPEFIYDIALNAQKNSLKQRGGGKINTGIINILIPTITAQIVRGTKGIETLEATVDILKNTSKKDVEYCYEFAKLARRLNKKPLPPPFTGKSIFEAYSQLLKKTFETRNKPFLEEFLTGFPKTQFIYRALAENKDSQSLIGNMEDAYGTFTASSSGHEADYCVVAIYLILCDYPKSKLIF